MDMASKEVKFYLRLAIDGKEQLVSAVTTAKGLKTSFNGVQKEVENFSYTFTNSVSYSKSET